MSAGGVFVSCNSPLVSGQPFLQQDNRRGLSLRNSVAGSVSGWIWEGGGRGGARRWATGAYPTRGGIDDWPGIGGGRRRLKQVRIRDSFPHFLADVAMVVLPAISLVSATERLLREVTSGHAVLFLQQSVCCGK